MADLLARGLSPDHQWRRKLTSEPVTLGRSATKSAWSVPWDPLISGLHVTLTWQDDRLHVRRAASGRNPVFFCGQPNDDFSVGLGESFVIGETTFSVVPGDGAGRDSGEVDLPLPLSIQTYSREELRQVRFADADERITVLARLPEIIRHAPSETDLQVRVLEVLLEGVPRAETAAVVRLADPAAKSIEVEVRCVRDRRSGLSPFRPSRRLVANAVRGRQSVLHTWAGAKQRDDYTANVSYDWALCVPLPEEAAPGWGLYLAGRLFQMLTTSRSPDNHQLKSDLKFTELVADIYGSLQQVRELEKRQALLARFLSKPVLDAVAKQGMEQVLKPRTTDVTVLFCDLRGFSRLSEHQQSDLDGLWLRVSGALAIMTGNIIATDGVVGDFQGDAAMGFWGWPLPMEDQAERAARTALAIRREFQRTGRNPTSPLYGFGCGIGMASGRAIAGQLGTPDQLKVGVFGPVVNVASRLESLTKRLNPSAILLDEATADKLARCENHAGMRCRRFARLRPQGMETVVIVHELLPRDERLAVLSDDEQQHYDHAREALEAGRWDEARSLLNELPADDGGVLLLRQFLARQGATPPEGWDGVITLDAK